MSHQDLNASGELRPNAVAIDPRKALAVTPAVAADEIQVAFALQPGEYREIRTPGKTVAATHAAAADGEADRPPFPVDALPSLLRRAVEIQAKAMHVDPAAAAIGLLVGSAAAIGNGAQVFVQPGWSEAVVLWAMIVAPSGGMKSATIRFVSQALEEVEEQLPLPDPAKPQEVARLFSTGANVPAIAMLSAKNPRGVSHVVDELSGWMSGMGQNTAQSNDNRAFYLNAYDGGRDDKDRKVAKTSRSKRLSISVLGGIQPKVAKVALEGGMNRESGFASRFMYVQPPRVLRDFNAVEPADGQELADVKRELTLAFLEFRRLPMPDGTPSEVHFDMDALSRILAFANAQARIAHLLADESVERACREKSRGWVARIAGIIALHEAVARYLARQDLLKPTAFDCKDIKVTADVVERAIRIVEWQLEENRRLFRAAEFDLASDEQRRHDELARKALCPISRSTTPREVQRRHKLATVEQAQTLLDGLVAEKLWVKEYPTPGPTGGAPSCRYRPVA